MLRIHCLQQWYNLSDPAMEDAPYEIASMRLFAGLSLDKAIPDRTTMMNFRHLLETHDLARQIFSDVSDSLSAEKREDLEDIDIEWHIARKPGTVKALKKHPHKNKGLIRTEYLQASIRAKVEHPFRIIKCQFGFVKARYRELKKNDGKLAMLFTLANFVRLDQMARLQG